MRIKINDKIYRLKEIESGVDSLMELVEETEYKDGDFLHSDWDDENITIIFKNQEGDQIYYHASKSCYYGTVLNNNRYWRDEGDFRYATEAEKKELLDALAKEGKRWNAEKLCIEDIPDELKKGDLAIFWDSDQAEARIGVYNQFYHGSPFPHEDHIGNGFRNAIKFESKKQFKRFINGVL